MLSLKDLCPRWDQCVTTLKDLLQRCDHLDRVVAKVGPICDRYLAEIRQTPHAVEVTAIFVLYSDMV